MEDAIETANAIASEHLEIVTKNPFEVMTKIQNAGVALDRGHVQPDAVDGTFLVTVIRA